MFKNEITSLLHYEVRIKESYIRWAQQVMDFTRNSISAWGVWLTDQGYYLLRDIINLIQF